MKRKIIRAAAGLAIAGTALGAAAAPASAAPTRPVKVTAVKNDNGSWTGNLTVNINQPVPGLTKPVKVTLSKSVTIPGFPGLPQLPTFPPSAP